MACTDNGMLIQGYEHSTHVRKALCNIACTDNGMLIQGYEHGTHVLTVTVARRSSLAGPIDYRRRNLWHV